MGGDHKCPHVGRHLRAHTGDRPYECKECPLRFARSDLLSRHVNKAHKAPDENGKPPAGKKGRRKSMPTSQHPPPPSPHHLNGDLNGSTHKPRRASFNPTSAMSYDSSAPSSSSSQPIPANATSTPAPQPPPLQAQSMYPHHPLLAGTPQPLQTWTSSPTMTMGHIATQDYSIPSNSGYSPVLPGGMGQTMGTNGMAPFQPPFTAVPMRLSGSEQGYMAGSPMGRNSSAGSLNSLGYEFGFKKRACDQCNHSKVRCDFAEPCHRCAHRNLRCSYNKPQKSRTIASIPSQRMSLPTTGTNASLTSSYSSSYSPQSHSSSPHSNTSPLHSTMPPPNVPSQQAPSMQPQTALPSGMVDPNTYMQAQNWSQSSYQQLSGAPMDQSLGLTQQNLPASQSPQAEMVYPSSSSSQYSQLPLPLPHRHSGSSSVSSPHANIGATPSLTSHSTSPGSEEPAERRTSTSSFNTTGWGSDHLKGGKSAEPMLAPDAYATSLSPVVVNANSGTTYQPDMNMYSWAPPVSATIDPRMQFRNSLSLEDDPEGVSRPPSSAASTFYDGMLDEASLTALNQRRRSSAGLWSSAFNQMSLQDVGSAGTIDPYTASQVAHARRPSYPVVHSTIPEGSSYNGSYSSNSGKMPSLGDVKDLWKLFMSEPMSGGMAPTASGEQVDPMSATAPANMGYGHAPAPMRPSMGSRGLSKSNSMPDLTSPMANAQPFFATYNNGVTPRPTIPQQSYTHNQPPADDAEDGVERDGEGNAVVMSRWKDSIKNRQASFEFDPNAHAKIKTTSPPSVSNSLSPPPSSSRASSATTAITSQSAVTGVPNMSFGSHNRPLASVLQHSSALQQTLAPERVPSFGVDNLPTPTNKTTFRANAAKFSSALARPGNKRLASQTLVPSDHTKKTSGDVGEAWHGLDGALENEAEGVEFQMPGGLVGMPGSTGMTPIGSGPGGQGQYFGWHPPSGMGTGMGMGVGVTGTGAGAQAQGY